MISRSSSSYQPLSDSQTMDHDRDTNTVGADSADSTHEMTSISIMQGTSCAVDSGGQTRIIKKFNNEIDFIPGKKCKSESMDWTNFHCVLCLGIGGFLVFWIFLLLRMYLPLENVLMIWWLKKSNKSEPILNLNSNHQLGQRLPFEDEIQIPTERT